MTLMPSSRTTAYEAPKSTPLLDHLRQQKAASRTARKQDLAAAKANGANGAKGKGKLPAVLPGATKAQLATAAQGGVQAAAGPSAKGAKGGKKDKDKKKKDKVAGAKSKDTSRSATPVPGEPAPTAAGANGPGVGTTNKGKGNSQKPAKKPKKERPVAPGTNGNAAVAAPSAPAGTKQQPVSGASATRSQPDPNQGESPGIFRDGLSVAEAAVLDQHRHLMQQRIRLAGHQQQAQQQQPAVGPAANAPTFGLPVYGNGPSQLPRPGPTFVPAHLQAPSTSSATSGPTPNKAQPQILRKPNVGGMLSVAGAGAQQQQAAAHLQEQPVTAAAAAASSSSSKRSRGGRGGAGRGGGGAGGEGGRGRGRGRSRGGGNAAAAAAAP